MTEPDEPSTGNRGPAASSSGRGRSEWLPAHQELEQLKRQHSAPWEIDILRANQLDAARLDTEILSMLQEQFLQIFSKFEQRTISALQPELTLLLDCMVFGLSILRDKPTPGMALLNLRFRSELASDQTSQSASGLPSEPLPAQASDWTADLAADTGQGILTISAPKTGRVAQRTGVEGPGLSLRQRSLYGMLAVAGRYLAGRAEASAAAEHWLDAPASSWRWRAWAGLRWAEAAHRLASLANALAFLRYGVYRSLLERMLRARLVYQQTNMARALSFEYLNRQLIWHEMSELLLFLLPLINLPRLKRLLLPYVPRLPSCTQTASRPRMNAVAGEADNGRKDRDMTGPCRICSTPRMVVPYQALPCCHCFCYFCLRSQSEHEPDYTCPECGQVVFAIRRRSHKRQ
ncbi:hypothetical protein WJX84_000025 [Apatococcus fuscideae]|uniref:RING-type E3 ubiquitin transferase (cysteine targeting) n=1 Tax=Apatococcus fuscideae TaxID=2026836 RepID=A0AAW1SPQ4_9CHLO